MRVAAALALTLALVAVSLGVVSAQHLPTGTWADKAKMADARTEAAVAAFRGRIYVFGGMTRGVHHATRLAQVLFNRIHSRPPTWLSHPLGVIGSWHEPPLQRSPSNSCTSGVITNVVSAGRSHQVGRAGYSESPPIFSRASSGHMPA